MTETDGTETAIRGLIETFVAAWNAADAKKLASTFAAYADFTAISGRHMRGRDLVERGHSEILATIYRGTKLAATVESIRLLRPDVAVLDVRFVLRKEDGSAVFGIPHTSAGVIATEDSGVWAIAVFRNMVPFSWPAAGPVETSVGQTKTA